MSAGALISTFAFLGTPEDDRLLKEIFTGITRSDVYRTGGIGHLLAGGNSWEITKPLEGLIARYITPEVLARVAAEYDRGRRLFVGTTNLDYGQLWMWDLAGMAKQGGPSSLALYRKVLLASSSPPIMFPPVEIEGFLFADGGVRDNVLTAGVVGRASAHIEDAKAEHAHLAEVEHRGEVYVIMNNKLSRRPAVAALWEQLGQIQWEGGCLALACVCIDLNTLRLWEHKPRFGGPSSQVGGRLLAKLGQRVTRRDDLDAQLGSRRKWCFLRMLLKELLRAPGNVRRANTDCGSNPDFDHHPAPQSIAQDLDDMRRAQTMGLADGAHQDLPPFRQFDLGRKVFEARVRAQCLPARDQLLAVQRRIDHFFGDRHGLVPTPGPRPHTPRIPPSPARSDPSRFDLD